MEPKQPTGNGEGQEFVAGSNEYAELGEEERVKAVSESTESAAAPPVGWLPRSEVAREVGVKLSSLAKVTATVKDIYPEWIGTYKHESGHQMEFVSPELRDILLEEYSGRIPAPDGWMTAGALGREFGKVDKTIQRIASKYLEEHPDWEREFTSSTNNVRTFYCPQLVTQIRQELSQRQAAPEGWLTFQQVAEKVGKDRSTIEKFTEDYKSTHPELFGEYDSHGRVTQYLSPELVAIVVEALSAFEEPPEGWATIGSVARRLGKDWRRVKQVADHYRGEYPEEFKVFTERGILPTEYISPKISSLISEELIPKVGIAPEGWMPRTDLIKSLSIPKQTVSKAAERYRPEHPEWFADYLVRGRVIEHYSEQLVEHVTQDLTEQRLTPPDGWQTMKELQQAAGHRSDGLLRPRVLALKEEHPDWVRIFMNPTGHLAEYYAPELVKRISDEVETYDPPPEGWRNSNQVASLLGIPEHAVRKIMNESRADHPEWIGRFRSLEDRRSSEFLHPQLISLVEQQLQVYGPAPSGWMTVKDVRQKYGNSTDIQTVIEVQLREHPEQAATYLNASGQLALHYGPELVQAVKELRQKVPNAPEGWMILGTLCQEVGRSQTFTQHAVEGFREDHPEWFHMYRTTTGHICEHYSPELVAEVQGIESAEIAPDGWLTNQGTAAKLGVDPSTAKRIAESFRAINPEWFKEYARERSRVIYQYYHPELISKIQEALQGKKLERSVLQETRLEQEKLSSGLEGFLTEVNQGQSDEAQEFRKLTELFGSERAIDILFQYRPEYRSIPLPEVKSMLGNYLGEFLVIRGEFNFETLATYPEFLSNPTLKEGLLGVVKGSVLRSYNEAKRANPHADDQEILAGRVAHLQEQGHELNNTAFNEVLDEIETYYRSLFEDIHKPDSLVDGLTSGRLFPDINQRINILELAAQNKVLIADEMGLGKSASAIIAKETLGVKQALVVVPSNVVEVWRTYLSDAKGSNGDAKGYFKEGQAPRVLIIDSYEELRVVNPGDYDYVILSQERLTDKYMEQMQRFSYDMLIVDEAHKLKNITEGKRAENLIKLSEQVNGSEDKYLALLSGTPVPNKVGDIAMVLKLLYPEKFEEVSNSELTNQILQGDILDLRSLLLPRMQMKELGESVAMPELHQETQKIQLSPKEREAYEVLLEEDELTATQKMQILRQFALNPAMLDATPDLEGSKAQEVGEALRRTFASKNKVVMFVNGYVEGVIRGDRNILDTLQVPEGVAVRVIDGSVSKSDRLVIQRELQQPDRRMLLLVSGQTADVGVDFSAADAADFYNDPWSEYDKHQELRRVYRPGLKDDLTSRTFIAEGTIEEGISEYIQAKYVAVEKLLRGIPITDIEQAMLKSAEKRADPDVEVNPELAHYYFSSWDRLMRFYGQTKESGEENFLQFLAQKGEDYASSYVDAGSRSYQANANRLSGTLIDRFARERGQAPEELRIVDLASGPEMLRRHIPDGYADSVTSIDINGHHFEAEDEKRIVGSFLQIPLEDKSVDYANLALALHYTNFVPSQGKYERIEVLKEMNRVLRDGGRGVISLLSTTDLKDLEGFREAVQKLGFKVVDEYTGEVESGSNFRSRVLTLEKVADCTKTPKELVRDLGPTGIKGLKFTKRGGAMRDSRRIASRFDFVDKEGSIEAHFNAIDQQVLEEEQATLNEMEGLKRQYGSVEAVPRENIIARGFARIFNGKRYVLFKGLRSAPGAVVVR